ncbi:hypothetical protein PFISCL1PPCAC_5723 [Pristionchus fissidentatus]|uniref:DDHD domain-containing protein n=1 Tax=Pristionchus fissidentatus TaxID=1538716 RepID=A0AAV5V4V3_9BILA|nr:hypothetical protein PFISCL1PPCAC_5723 [Pristionchus fissidentatus]
MSAEPEQAKEATEEGMGTVEVNKLSDQKKDKVFEKSKPVQQQPKKMARETTEDGSTVNSQRGTITTPPAPIPPLRSRRRRVTELRCGEVRWFYRRKDLDSKWIPFKGQDSIRLEIRWREDHSMEVDQQAKSILTQMGEEVVVLDGLYRMSDDHSKITAVYWKDDEAELRRGSWFLPDGQPIQASMADSIEAHHLQYFRGQTIPEGTSMFSDKEASRKPQLTELQLPENIEVKWSSVIDVFLYSTTKASRFLRYVTWGKDTKLRRGYEKEAEWEDGQAEVSHLILVVHGIGQKGYENLIAKNTEQIRDGINLVMDKQYPEEKSRPMLLPVEWRSQLVLDDGQTDWITLPKMSSVRNTLNSTAMDIMYYQSPLYRQEIVGGVVKAINSVYSLFKKHNPSYNGPVSIFAHSLGSVISYDICTHWSPLLLYDEYVANAIKAQLEDQESASTSEAADSMRILQEVREKLQKEMEGGIRTVLQAREESLQFPVANLFCVGSPLGVFLVMRGAKADTIIPPKDAVARVFNIFHPYDPVAYRLEPLYAPELKDIRPVKLFAYTDLKSKQNYDEITPDVYKNYMKKKKAAERKGMKNGEDKKGSKKMKDPVPNEDEIDEEDEVDSDDSASNVRSACSSPRSLSPQREEAGRNTEKTASGGKGGGGWWFNKEKGVEKKNEVEKAKEAEPEVKMTEAEKIISSIPEDRRPQKRIDFAVQPALTDKSYWSVLKSHFSYWTNPDLSMFLVNVIYKQRDEAAKLAIDQAAAEAKACETPLDTAMELPHAEGTVQQVQQLQQVEETTREKAGTESSASTASLLSVDTVVSCREPSLSAKTPQSELLTPGCESPLSVMNLPREEHLLPDAPGRLPTPARPPPPVSERNGI